MFSAKLSIPKTGQGWGEENQPNLVGHFFCYSNGDSKGFTVTKAGLTQSETN